MSVLGKKSHFVVVAEDINDLGEARVLDPDAMGKTFLESLFSWHRQVSGGMKMMWEVDIDIDLNTHD